MEGKKMKKTVFWCLALAMCLGMKIHAQNSGVANSGNYPVDYGIAYMNMVGYSKSATIRDLFGPNALFASTYNGVPSKVTVESTSGNRNEFSAILLIEIKQKDTEEYVRLLRMQVRFQADSVTEKSYVRYARVVIFRTDQIFEQQSNGSERQDGQVIGFFGPAMKWFWDMSKYLSL